VLSQPAVRLANAVISEAVKARASDVHIEPQEKDVRVRYRIDGILREGNDLRPELRGQLWSLASKSWQEWILLRGACRKTVESSSDLTVKRLTFVCPPSLLFTGERLNSGF